MSGLPEELVDHALHLRLGVVDGLVRCVWFVVNGDYAVIARANTYIGTEGGDPVVGTLPVDESRKGLVDGVSWGTALQNRNNVTIEMNQ